jgi:uncharacterized membrane protein YfcA
MGTMGALCVVLGAAAGGFAQGLSGFAFGLVALSIWVWVLEPTVIGPLIVIGAVAGQFATAGILRRGWQPALFLPFVVGGVFGVPLGVALLHYVDPLAFKFGVGMLLVLWCLAVSFARDLPRVRWGGRIADGVVGWVGGVMGGLAGLTGPAPILWTSLRGWDRHTQRSVFQVFSLSMQCLTMIAYASSGVVTGELAVPLALTLPAMLAGVYFGSALYRRISDRAFVRVVLAFLAVSGVILVATSIAALS